MLFLKCKYRAMQLQLRASILLIALGFLALTACEKEEDDPPSTSGTGAAYPAGSGGATFYLNSTLPYVFSSLTLNGTNLGGFNQYVTSGSPSCGLNSTGVVISVVRPAGNYAWCATRDNGDTYSGTITVPNGSCVLRGIGSSDIGSCGSGSGACNWQLNPSSLSVNAVMSDMCGEPNGGITLNITNQSGQALKMGICIGLDGGSWYSTADGTFDTGVAPGQTINPWHCYSNGLYKIYVIDLSTYLANNCTYPSCS